MKLIKTIILIIVCLYVGAYIGKANMHKGATAVVKKAKGICVRVKVIWNEDNTEQEKSNNGN